MWKLALRPRSCCSGIICFDFSVLCLCSVDSLHKEIITNYLVFLMASFVKSYTNFVKFKAMLRKDPWNGIQKAPFSFSHLSEKNLKFAAFSNFFFSVSLSSKIHLLLFRYFLELVLKNRSLYKHGFFFYLMECLTRSDLRLTK